MRMYYKAERNRDLAKTYRRVLRQLGTQARYCTRRELVMLTLAQRAPRFYVTYETARRIVRQMLAGKRVQCDNPLKEQMYTDLTQMVAEYIAKHPRRRVSLQEALMVVLTEYTAPGFYISEGTALNLLNEMEHKANGGGKIAA